jgi:hypothetical protein
MGPDSCKFYVFVISFLTNGTLRVVMDALKSGELLVGPDEIIVYKLILNRL